MRRDLSPRLPAHRRSSLASAQGLVGEVLPSNITSIQITQGIHSEILSKAAINNSVSFSGLTIESYFLSITLIIIIWKLWNE